MSFSELSNQLLRIYFSDCFFYLIIVFDVLNVVEEVTVCLLLSHRM